MQAKYTCFYQIKVSVICDTSLLVRDHHTYIYTSLRQLEFNPKNKKNTLLQLQRNCSGFIFFVLRKVLCKNYLTKKIDTNKSWDCKDRWYCQLYVCTNLKNRNAMNLSICHTMKYEIVRIILKYSSLTGILEFFGIFQQYLSCRIVNNP